MKTITINKPTKMKTIKLNKNGKARQPNKKKQSREIWIESGNSLNHGITLKIGSDWGCLNGFKKSDAKKLFNAISSAIKTAFPEAVINPWADAEHGIPDFE